MPEIAYTHSLVQFNIASGSSKTPSQSQKWSPNYPINLALFSFYLTWSVLFQTYPSILSSGSQFLASTPPLSCTSPNDHASRLRSRSSHFFISSANLNYQCPSPGPLLQPPDWFSSATLLPIKSIHCHTNQIDLLKIKIRSCPIACVKPFKFLNLDFR